MPVVSALFAQMDSRKQKIVLCSTSGIVLYLIYINLFVLKIKPKSDYPLKTLYPRAFQTGQNHLIYYDFTTVE